MPNAQPAPKVVTVEMTKLRMRREEAHGLINRLSSDLSRLDQLIKEICGDSLDKDRMQRDPHYVSDNLHDAVSPLMQYDLRRLRELILRGL